MLLEVVNKICERGIGIGNLPVVQAIFVDSRIRCGGLVVIVRIVQVYPNKVWPGGMSAQPCLRVLHYLHAAALYPPPTRLCGRMLRKIVVEIKSTIQSRRKSLAIENHRADKGRRMITLPMQQF